MDETYQLKAIILKREAFRENDTRVVVYSREKGRLDLVARGTKKVKSKMAGHLEPITLANLMAVRGRSFDYIGSARSENIFAAIKEDLENINAAGQAINIFLDLIKPEERDDKIFDMLLIFLETLNDKKSDSGLLSAFFTLKIFDLLGYRPELQNCLVCQEKIKPEGNRFDPHKGGVVCAGCAKPGGAGMPVSDDAIKILRMALNDSFDKLIKFEISDKLKTETISVVGSFVKYNHG